MVVPDDLGVNLELPLFTTVQQRVYEYVAAGLRGEDGKPFHNRGGDEVGGLSLVHAIAGSHSPSVRIGRKWQVRFAMRLSDGVALTIAFPDRVWEREKVTFRRN
jgi:hypothetical protein